jgi:hypothetical protein
MILLRRVLWWFGTISAHRSLFLFFAIIMCFSFKDGGEIVGHWKRLTKRWYNLCSPDEWLRGIWSRWEGEIVSLDQSLCRKL